MTCSRTSNTKTRKRQDSLGGTLWFSSSWQRLHTMLPWFLVTLPVSPTTSFSEFRARAFHSHLPKLPLPPPWVKLLQDCLRHLWRGLRTLNDLHVGFGILTIYSALYTPHTTVLRRLPHYRGGEKETRTPEERPCPHTAAHPYGMPLHHCEKLATLRALQLRTITAIS